MKHIGVSFYKLFFFALVSISFALLCAAFPVKASALEISSQTIQAIPPGGNSCPQVTAANFTPYIYDGALDSFEFTISDPSYVALIGSAGDTPISFQLMTRSIDATGALRVHADIASTRVIGTLPISVTLLSARSGRPVCMTVVSMSVGSGSATIQPIVPVVSTTPKPSIVSVAPKPTVVMPTSKPTATLPSASATQNVLTTGSASGSVVSTVKNPLSNVCSSDAGAYRLWLILLVLYTIIVGAALWAEFPMSLAWARTPERIASIILALLLLLLAFWYFSISCRAALWMPLVAFLVAVLGLLAAFWNHPRVTQLLLIQEKKTSVIVTPPPPIKK